MITQSFSDNTFIYCIQNRLENTNHILPQRLPYNMQHINSLPPIIGLIQLLASLIYLTTTTTIATIATRPPRGFCGTIDLMARNDPICYNYIKTIQQTNRYRQPDGGITKNNYPLVYYRLQTLGNRLDNLETLTINQLLSQTIKRKLLIPHDNDGASQVPTTGQEFHTKKSYIEGNTVGGNLRNLDNNQAEDSDAIWEDKIERQSTNAKDVSSTSSATSTSILSSNLLDKPTNNENDSILDSSSSSFVYNDKFNHHHKNRRINDLQVYLNENVHCGEAIMRYICRYLYPSCHYSSMQRGAVPLVRPPCRKDCILLRDMYCAQVPWSVVIDGLKEILNSTLFEHVLPIDILVEENENLLSSTKPSVHYYWPHERSFLSCNSLPLDDTPHQVESKKFKLIPSSVASHHSWPICSDAQLDQTIDRQQSERVELQYSNTSNRELSDKFKCRRGRGSDYLGQVASTKSGRKCQSWRSQWPHEHNYKSELMFSEMIQIDPKNYCRNPGGLEMLPWCYTRDPLIRWEYCDIQEC